MLILFNKKLVKVKLFLDGGTSSYDVAESLQVLSPGLPLIMRHAIYSPVLLWLAFVPLLHATPLRA